MPPAKNGLVFLMQIGDKLRSGKPHDGRAPDYDDWSPTAIPWYGTRFLNQAVEISPWGSVDEKALKEQLAKELRIRAPELPFPQNAVEGQLPLTMGGGIGQSRICMLMLNKVISAKYRQLSGPTR